MKKILLILLLLLNITLYSQQNILLQSFNYEYDNNLNNINDIFYISLINNTLLHIIIDENFIVTDSQLYNIIDHNIHQTKYNIHINFNVYSNITNIIYPFEIIIELNLNTNNDNLITYMYINNLKITIIGFSIILY